MINRRHQTIMLIPDHFSTSTMQQEIPWWLEYLIQKKTKKIPGQSPQIPSSTGAGIYGSYFSTGFNLKIIFSSTIFKSKIDLHLSEILQWHLENNIFKKGTQQNMPWKKYMRCSGQTIGATPAMVQMGNRKSNFCNKWRVTITSTQQWNNRNNSHIYFSDRFIIDQ